MKCQNIIIISYFLLSDLIYINSIEVLYCRYKWNLCPTTCFNDSLPYMIDVQTFTTTFQFLTSCFSTGIPSILLFFMGPWSDAHGRKPLLILTTLGKLPLRLRSWMWRFNFVLKITPRILSVLDWSFGSRVTLFS